jgi:hypothetical protein
MGGKKNTIANNNALIVQVKKITIIIYGKLLGVWPA